MRAMRWRRAVMAWVVAAWGCTFDDIDIRLAARDATLDEVLVSPDAAPLDDATTPNDAAPTDAIDTGFCDTGPGPLGACGGQGERCCAFGLCEGCDCDGAVRARGLRA